MLLAIASVVLMTLDHRQHHLESIRAGISVLLYPLQYAIDLPVSLAHWSRESLATRDALLNENQRLRTEQLLFQARLQKFEALETENERLRELLNSSRKVGERVLIGELVTIDLDPFRHQVVINKGSRHGVYEGQPLLDANGVMGQVIHVTPMTNTAMLITDPSHAIPAQVNRSGLRVIAIGTGESHRLEVPHIPNNADIREGDLLVTSGLDRRFPPGYPVARVVSVRKDPSQPYSLVTAEPTAHLERSREVLLAWPTWRDEGTR